MSLVEIKNLKLDFLAGERALRAVDDVSLTVNAGETVCLVGESGCGKSVTALSIARLVPTPPARYAGGEIWLNGRDVLKMSKAELRNIRGGVVSYIFQDPGASLNPVFRVGNQIKESLKLHRPGKGERRGGDPAAEAGGHSRAGIAHPRLSAPDVGRDAAAGDDRDGAGVRARSCSWPTSRPRRWT